MTFSSLFQILKRNLVITSSVVVFLFCLAVFFVRNGQIRRLSADFDDLSVRRTRMLKNFKYAAGLEDDLAAIKVMDGEIDKRLFHAEDLAGNQRYFYQIESATGAKLQNLQQISASATTGKRDKKAAKRAAKAKYQEVAYELNVVGSYEDALRFLRNLEGGSAFYRLNGLSIAEVRVGQNETAVGMRLGLEILGSK